jgi:hypothetical protein
MDRKSIKKLEVKKNLLIKEGNAKEKINEVKSLISK